MIVGVIKETFPGEHRVALVPDSVTALTRIGLEVLIETCAGLAAGITDDQFTAKGARMADRATVMSSADVVLQVRLLGANLEAGQADLPQYRKDQTVIGFCEPLAEAEAARQLAETGVTSLSMELIPRITRAQSMDALSSMATVAGYKAVLLGAQHLPKMFPMLMTAAGTIAPARVFIVGAGVAGLQAIATARRLGAVVSAYDVRPAVKEQVESLGGEFIEMELEAGTSEDKGGYAREMNEEFYRKQRELMTRVVAENDIVITTAAIPGKKSPILVTADMVKGMHAGSVIVDLAAERGGNCELTEADKTVVHNGVTIIGTTNLPATVPFHASQMLARNLTTLLKHLLKDGELVFDMADEITRDTTVTRGGDVVNARVREVLGLPALDPPAAPSDTQESPS